MAEDTGVPGGAERETRTEEAPPAPEMNQTHAVSVGDKVQLNGTLFHVSSGQYDWACTGPDGKDVPLTNPTMPGPSFTAEQVGAYVSTLTTDDGVATITVNAADSDASTAPPPSVSGEGAFGSGMASEEARRQEEARRAQE